MQMNLFRWGSRVLFSRPFIIFILVDAIREDRMKQDVVLLP